MNTEYNDNQINHLDHSEGVETPEIFKTFKDPKELKKAFILSEILKKPEW